MGRTRDRGAFLAMVLHFSFVVRREHPPDEPKQDHSFLLTFRFQTYRATIRPWEEPMLGLMGMDLPPFRLGHYGDRWKLRVGTPQVDKELSEFSIVGCLSL